MLLILFKNFLYKSTERNHFGQPYNKKDVFMEIGFDTAYLICVKCKIKDPCLRKMFKRILYLRFFKRFFFYFFLFVVEHLYTEKSSFITILLTSA